MKGTTGGMLLTAKLAHVGAVLAVFLFSLALPKLAHADDKQTIKYINGPPPIESPVNVYGVYEPPPDDESSRDEMAGLFGYNSGAALGITHGNTLNANHNDAFSYNNKTASTDKKKNKGDCQDTASDPVVVSDGAKVVAIPLFSTPGEMGLKYALYYHSVNSGSAWAYNPWTSSISYILDLYCGFTNPNIPCSQVTLYRPDGSSVSFSGNHASYGNFPEIGGGGLATLVHNSNGTWTLHDEDSTVQTYDKYGYFISIEDTSGIGWTVNSSSTTNGVSLDRAPPVHPCGVPTGLHPMCIDPPPRPPSNPPITTTTVVTHTDGRSYTIVSVTKNPGTTYSTATVTVTDPVGNQYSYALNEYKVPNGSGLWAWDVASLSFPGSPATTMTFNYTGSNSLLSGVSYNGTAYWTTSYDSNGRVSSDGAADGTERTSILYAFPSGGMVATITNPLGLTTTNTYTTDSQGNYLLSKVSNSAVQGCGATTNSMAWDGNDNLTQTVDNDGITHTYSYAANGQLQTETDAYGTAVARKIDYVWDPNAQLNRPLSLTVEGESKTSYTYNAQNRLASVTRTNLTGLGTPNQSLTTTYAYTLYASGMVQTMTITAPSPGGSDHRTSTYDTLGNLTSVTDGLGHVTTYSSYNGLGEVGKVVGPNGDETDYSYDGRGRIASKTTHPYGTAATWTYAYDGFGLLAKETAPDGEITIWNRDAETRVKTMTHNDKDGTSTETFTYDANDDIIADVTARGSDLGKASYYAYDGLGRVYQVKGSHGQVLTYAYDGNGNVLSVTDALGHQTTYAYDGLNRLEGSMDAAGGVTSYAYDAGDHLTRVTDPRGLVTTYSYDGLGQLWQQASPDTGTTDYNYDAYGRLGSFVRADGAQTDLGYDALNRLTSKAAGGITRTYTWDNCTGGAGRLCAASNQGYDSVDYTYSPEGWMTKRSISISGGPSYSLGYAYDAMGHLTAVDYPDGNEALYDYTDGAVADVRMKVGIYNIYGVTAISYRPMDLAMSNWTSYNGLPNTITYDSDLRPTAISVPNVESLAFTYDTDNRIIQLANGMNGSLSQSLGYDALNRLTTIRSGVENASFSYDADGNRTYQTVNGSAVSFNYVTTSNRLMSMSNGTTYGYNADGDMTTVNGTTAYQYGPFDRLGSAGGEAYRTSAEGQRIFKQGGSGTTYFAPDAGGTLLAEYDPNGVWLDYVWLNGKLVTVVTSNGGVYPVHDDQTGRPVAMTNLGNQSIIWQAQNLPFKSNVTVTTWFGFNLGFPGQYWDSEDNLWHNGARDYDASLGRYTEPDPLGLGGGIDPYVYADNDPISNVDPLGLCNSCNKLESGFAIGAVDADKFANATGNDATYLGGIAGGGAVIGAVTASPQMLAAAGGIAVVAGGVGTVSEATSIASGLLNTAASGGDFRYIGRAVVTSILGRMTGELVGAIPVIGPDISDWTSGYLESHIDSWNALPSPCDVP